MSGLNNVLVIATKPKAKENVRMAAMFLFYIIESVLILEHLLPYII
jgi:hypothetical protein